MKKLSVALIELLRSFISIMGIMFALLFMRGLFTYQNVINSHEMRWCAIIALVFSFFHIFIFTDNITEKMSIKLRCLISALPCFATAGFLVFRFTSSSLLGWHMSGEHSLNQANFDFCISIVVGAVVLLLVLFLVEMQFKKIGKSYDKALAAYKKGSN